MTPVVLELLMERQQVLYREELAAWRRLLALPRLFDRAHVDHGPSTPHEIVHERGTVRLRRYARRAVSTYEEPVLICPALVSRPDLLDFHPDRSIVRQLLGRGFDVYLIDWGVPSAVDRRLRLRDHVADSMRRVADRVLAGTRCGRFHLLGYCLGGTMATMFTALHPESIASLALMAAPIDCARPESLLHVWSDPRYFDVDSLIAAFGNCPAAFLRGCFAASRPLADRYAEYVDVYERLDDDRSVRDFFALQRWASDTVAVAGETFREVVARLYQRNELVGGTFTLGDAPVRLERISCPLLLLMAGADHLVPPAQTEGIIPRVRSTDIRAMTLDGGHVALAVSTKAHKSFWPAATQWMAERSSRV